MANERDNERKLLGRALQGEHCAFGVLVRRHVESLWRSFALNGVPSSDIEDLIQDVIVDAWKGLQSYDETRGTFRTWLRGIAHYRLLRWFQERGRNPGPIAIDWDLLVELADSAPEQGSVPDDLTTERRRHIGTLLRGLNRSDRDLIELRVFEGLSYAEVGRLQGRSAGAARQHFYRIIGRLGGNSGMTEHG